MSANAPVWVTALGLIAALIGAGGGIWNALNIKATRRKLSAEASKAEVDAIAIVGKAAVDLLEPFRARVRELNSEVDVAHARINSLCNEIERLRSAILAETADLAELRHMVANLRPSPWRSLPPTDRD